MRLIIFGPQGAGKGTQAERIAEKYQIPSISTGEIFRWAMKGKTALGNRVSAYVDAGKLVPDELTIGVVSERIGADDCADGFLLDGFPRNVDQAKALDVLLRDVEVTLDAALVIDVPEEESIRRLTGRRVCENCGHNYHVDSPPEKNWTCDICGGNVVARSDDTEDGIRERLRNYNESTTPLRQYYEERGLLKEVSGIGSPDEVFSRIVEALG
ncbi:MAG TPA: adenylate kinase [Actinomycetota bacterium]|nr:adenylate kinase [Actinomycetota bacterium]